MYEGSFETSNSIFDEEIVVLLPHKLIDFCV